MEAGDRPCNETPAIGGPGHRVMADDSFFREVDEEIRNDRVKALWDRFGAFLILLAILIVLGTAAWVGWSYWQETRANASGDQFSQAQALAAEGKTDEAQAVLQKLEADGHASYPVLARLRIASMLAAKKDSAGAVSAFDAVAADGSVPPVLRDMARLRAGYILVDTGSYEDVVKRVEVLDVEANPLRFSAREALALAAWKAGKTDDARKFFEGLSEDPQTPADIRQRATMMLELIRGGDTTS
jgi:hypothetical protein